MKRVLVITSGYCGKASANGLCARALVDEMKYRGLQVDVISRENEEMASDDEYQAIPVYTKKCIKIRSSKRGFIFRCFRFFKNFFKNIWMPEYDKELTQGIVVAAEGVIKKNKPDIILPIFFPSEAVIAGYRLAKMFPECALMPYEVDSASDGIAGSTSFFGKYILLAYRRLLKRVYHKSKMIMILKCHENAWSNEFKRYLPKMRVIDLPLLCDNSVCGEDVGSGKTEALYSGILNYHYRSPKKVLEVFSALDNKDFKLSFFSRGCEDALSEATQQDERIVSYGYVGQDELNKAIQQATVLVNIGNKVSNSLPSKLITYMTYGKPIIHFSLQENDVCVEYLNKYPLSLVIREDEKVMQAALKVERFINEIKGKIVEYDTLCEAFPNNMPSYSVDVLLDYME